MVACLREREAINFKPLEPHQRMLPFEAHRRITHVDHDDFVRLHSAARHTFQQVDQMLRPVADKGEDRQAHRRSHRSRR